MAEYGEVERVNQTAARRKYGMVHALRRGHEAGVTWDITASI
jgi:hypothetical protein